MASDLAERVLSKLTTPGDAAREEGVDLFTDFLLGRRLAELVDVEATVRIVVGAVTEQNVGTIVARHVSPAWDRHRERASELGEKLGDAFPEDAREQIEEILAKQRPPPMAWSKGAVDPALVQKLFAPALQRTLLSFAKKLPLVGLGGGPGVGAGGEGDKGLAGLAGKLGKEAAKRASKLAGSVSKSVIGGISAEMNDRLQEAARDFSKEAQRELREAIAERLASEEGQKLAKEIRRQALDRVFSTELAVLMRDVETLPRRELEALVGPVLAHNAGRELGRRVIDEELRAFLDIEGAKTLADLARELGVLDELRPIVRERVDHLARELFPTRPFRAWLERLVADEG